MIIFGANKIIKNFDNDTVKELNLVDILEYLNKLANKIRKKHKIRKVNKINYDNFIDFGILMGCDYIKPIRNLSYEDLFEEFIVADLNVRETLRILKIKEDLLNIEIPHNFIDQWKKAREYFLNPEVYEPRQIDISLACPNKVKLLKYLTNYCNFDNEKISNDVNNLEIYIDNIKFNNSYTYNYSNLKLIEVDKKSIDNNENPQNYTDDYDLPIIILK